MAQFRKLSPTFWSDPVIQELSNNAKYLYLYLITNPHSDITGLYKISARTIMFETNLESDDYGVALLELGNEGKVCYDGHVMFVRNTLKHHYTRSPKLLASFRTSVDLIPHCDPKVEFIKTYGQMLGYPQFQVSHVDQTSTGEGPVLTDYSQTKGTSNWATRMYTEVTGQFAVPPSHRAEVIDSIIAIGGHFETDQEVLDHLKKNFIRWTGTKTKDGRTYSPLNPGWIEWALTESVSTGIIQSKYSAA